VDFDSEQIIELVESGDPHFRKIASKAIVDAFHAYSSLFFNYISSDQITADLAKFANQRFIFLVAGFEEASLFPDKERYSCFSELFVEYSLFFIKLKEYINQGGTDGHRLLKTLYATFPGIRPDLRSYYPSYPLSVEPRNDSKSQLMVFITGNCNLDCPYCFSNTLERKEMSLADFETILRWARKNGIKRVTLCGGEPTLHTQFNKILSLTGSYGFTTYFASNLTTDCSSFDAFNHKIIDLIYIHITKPVLIKPLLRERFISHVLYAKQLGIKLAYRVNIPDVSIGIDDWLDIMGETGITALNIALTFPSGDKKNQYVKVDDFARYAGLVSSIIEKGYRKGLQLLFAKPIPLCLFDKEMQRRLASNTNFLPVCGTHHRNFTHNVCIYPDLSIRPCLGVTGSVIRFDEYISWQTIEDFCTDVIRPLLRKPLFDACTDCFLYDRKLCQGSCLSYKKKP
jgi:MoaA/NifB/PqqE/SkfB family radical SAM enzyme